MKTLVYGIIGVLVVIGTAIGGFLGFDKKQDVPYAIGDQVEEFTLQDLAGQNVSLADVAGTSGTILIFTSNSCPFAKLYDDRIIQLQDVYGDMGYPLILINPIDPNLKPGDSRDELQKWVSDHNFVGTYLLDLEGLYMRFGAEKTPEVYLLDAERKLRYRGAIDDSAVGAANVSEKYLENAIRALENNEVPEPSQTRVMGCVIKS